MMQESQFRGLNDAQVIENRRKYGTNLLTPPDKVPLWKQYLRKFGDPLIIILLIAGVLSVGISCYEYWGLSGGGSVFFEPVGIFIAILLATGLAFNFERLAEKEFAILSQVNDDEPVEVIRNGMTTMVPKKDVVVGDVVILNTGAEVPADGVLLKAVQLQVDESTLTGELICSKTVNEAEFDKDATYPSNHVLRGTKVMDGHGVMEVTVVGDRTESGKLLEAAQIEDNVKTPLNEQLDRLGGWISDMSYSIAGIIIVAKLFVYFGFAWSAWLLLIPTAVFFWLVVKKFKVFPKWACVVTIASFFAVFIGGVLLLHAYLMPAGQLPELLAYTLQTFMIAVTLVVVAVPEGLPMAVTLSLAFSMRRMFKTNNLVRKMHACETMGATTVICTDKTGTLTMNRMKVESARFYSLLSKDKSCAEIQRFIDEGIALNSTAELDLTHTEPSVLGNPTEGALLLWLRDRGVDYQQLRSTCPVLEELQFSTERKYMATVVRSNVNGKRVVYVKGAPEIVAGMSKTIAGGATKEMIDGELADFQSHAMRTLGFAYQILDETQTAIENNKITADGLVFLGIVAISDPVRDDVREAIVECLNAGIEVKIVTGDTPGIAREIARQIGLLSETDEADCVITGPELAALDDDALRRRVGKLKLIARARPMDKKRLVEALQANNHVVAVTGDGTNDAPALNTAHVGISMGDGTAVAKSASDITIVDNSFASINRAVMWGRSLYQNIQRFLLFQLTVNVSACLIVLAGAFMGTATPLTVTQMLWVNLIMDTFGAMALASLPPTKRVMLEKPRDRNAFIIGKDMALNISGVGIAFFIMLLLLLYIFEHADITCMADFLHLRLGAANGITPYEQTLLFSIFVWTHFWYMFNARSFYTGKSIFSLKLSTGFLTIVAVIIIGQLLIVEAGYDFFNVAPMFHVAESARLGIHPQGWIDFIVIVALSSLVLWIRELWSVLKRWAGYER
ncbi:MAG: cation-translocating P-type ATPase [Prevotella sp.]|nr:cation-translocating P-type ATPase [Prevotella sp.]